MSENLEFSNAVMLGFFSYYGKKISTKLKIFLRKKNMFEVVLYDSDERDELQTLFQKNKIDYLEYSTACKKVPRPLMEFLEYHFFINNRHKEWYILQQL